MALVSVSPQPERASQPLIMRLDHQATPRQEDDRLEPQFLVQCDNRLFIDARGWRAQAKSYYARAIARKPSDLKRHVQRIVLLAEMADEDIAGALFDLFLVLGQGGAALRRRMLAHARPHLRSEDYGLFRRHLQERSVTLPFHWFALKSSMLSRGVTGNTRLIEKGGAATRQDQGLLEEARELIAYGQVELALETLEKALLTDPARLEVHRALLEIYRHVRDQGRVAKMLRRLQGSPNPALAEWHHLLAQLESQSEMLRGDSNR
jgi:tetratricopeptide (TPR) repeat protein